MINIPWKAIPLTFIALWLVGGLFLPLPGVDIIFHLAIGWALFVANTMPNVSWSYSGFLIALVAILVFLIGLHGLATWISRNRGHSWTMRRSFIVLGLVLLTFIAGISAVGIAHQFSWIANSPRPLYEGGGVRVAAYRAQAISNIRQIGIGLQNYESNFNRFPECEFSRNGELLFGWTAIIKVYVEGGAIVGFQPDKPWNSPENESSFRPRFRAYESPRVNPNELVQGYGPIHFAGNIEVLRPRSGIGFKDITDGKAMTILLGEVPTGFRPWAHPLNLRDPAKGIGFASDKFGSPVSGQDLIVCLADISTRSISAKIHPKVLKALATPNGNEPIEDYDEIGKSAP